MAIPKLEDTYYVFGDVRTSKIGTVIIRYGVEQHLASYCWYMEEFYPGRVAKHARGTVSLVKN